MTVPRRIQRKRTKGWRMPANTVYVGRPTKWGNPFSDPAIDWSVVGLAPTRHDLVNAFETSIDLTLLKQILGPAETEKVVRRQIKIKRELHELRGKNLACWCPLYEPCHANVLLRWANR